MLLIDEIAALKLYSMEIEGTCNSFNFLLNAALREKNRKKVVVGVRESMRAVKF
jgi:hypothetical protein